MNALTLSNLALAHLGEEPLAALDANTPTARLCAQFWPYARDEILSRHDWTAATKRVVLSPTETPADGTVVFTKPADALRLLHLSTEAQRLADGLLVATKGTEKITLTYVQRLEEFAPFPAPFVSALGFLLASMLAMPITHDLKRKQLLYAEHRQSLLEAVGQDNQDSGKLVMMNEPKNTFVISGPQGPAGATGEIGPAGVQGAAGADNSSMTGEVKAVAFATAPTGWLVCDGALVSRTTYVDLFAAISTAYGTGDDATTFALPDLRGRVPIGAGEGIGLDIRVLGAKGGSQHAQAHRHSVTPNSRGGGLSATTVPGYYAAGTDNWYQNFTWDSTISGTGQSGNMQPWAALNYIIKT